MYNYIPLEQAADILDSYRKPVNSKERLNLIKGKPLDELFPYYGATGQVGWIDSFLTDGEYILLGEDGAPFLNPYAEKAYIIYGKTWVNNHAHILRSKTNNEFLCYYLNYFNYKNYVSGTTRLKLTQAQMRKIPIPNIPSDEQSRIVASIEELFSELDKAVDTLKTTKEQLEVYRQTILVDAFRAATNSTYLKVGCVCAKIVDCPHSTPKWEKSGKLCLRTTNFKRGYLDLQSPNYVSEETFHDRNRRIIPQPGDVLYSREGSVLGIACTIPSNVYPCLGQRMMLLRSGEKLNNRYLMHYLNSPMVTNHVIATKGGTGSPHINVGDIKEFKIPIPSLEEQSNIVRQIEEQLSSCDNVEKTVDAILAQADAMRQSILKQAFEGTL
jgi:type I restriction enzyme S subunit